MKKLISFVLAFALLLTLILPATADTTIKQDSIVQTGSMTLNYTVAVTYTVIIPESVTIDPVTKTGSGTITIEAGALIPYENHLQINISSENYDTDAKKFMMQEKSNSSDYLYYTIKDEKTSNEISTGACVLAADSNEAASVTLVYQAEPTYSGTYTDTLTFTVVVQPEI